MGNQSDINPEDESIQNTFLENELSMQRELRERELASQPQVVGGASSGPGDQSQNRIDVESNGSDQKGKYQSELDSQCKSLEDDRVAQKEFFQNEMMSQRKEREDKFLSRKEHYQTEMEDKFVSQKEAYHDELELLRKTMMDEQLSQKEQYQNELRLQRQEFEDQLNQKQLELDIINKNYKMELRSSAQIISNLDNKVSDFNTEISQMKQWCKKYDNMVKKLLDGSQSDKWGDGNLVRSGSVTKKGSMVIRSVSKG